MPILDVTSSLSKPPQHAKDKNVPPELSVWDPPPQPQRSPTQNINWMHLGFLDAPHTNKMKACGLSGCLVRKEDECI